jgi:2-iminobutanoate/2-iminopropanoate deaminase
MGSAGGLHDHESKDVAGPKANYEEQVMTRKNITAEGAVAVGPYSHAIISGEHVFLSGQTPLNSETGKLVEGSIGDQTEQCFRNLGAVLEAGGMTFEDVVKVNVFLTDMGNFTAMNQVYAGQFSEPYPARTTIGVASLPLGADVEIELVAIRPGP